MPHGDDEPPVFCQAPKRYFFADDPDSQKSEVKAKKIVKKRYQPKQKQING
jgi:hypothetical protein